MRKSFLIVSLITLISVAGISVLSAQEQPKPEKDTVNMDTNAKPEVYYAIEDEESMPDSNGNSLGSGTIAIVLGAVIVLGGAAFLLLRKKK